MKDLVASKKDKKNGYLEKDEITNTPRKIKKKATVKFLNVNNDYEWKIKKINQYNKLKN